MRQTTSVASVSRRTAVAVLAALVVGPLLRTVAVACGAREILKRASRSRPAIMIVKGRNHFVVTTGVFGKTDLVEVLDPYLCRRYNFSQKEFGQYYGGMGLMLSVAPTASECEARKTSLALCATLGFAAWSLFLVARKIRRIIQRKALS